MKEANYIVGIDLGTTHCVVAYTNAQIDDNEEPEINIFEIPQITAPGELNALPMLPSFIFLPGEHDTPEGSLTLPWDEKPDLAIGEFARNRGPDIPNRLVFSAKSWLCHNGVDRTKPILPWNSPEDTMRISPVEASSFLLSHIKNAWDNEFAQDDPDLKLENQELYLTVPASFDAVARELTIKSAESAGLSNMTLLEEPQAAFYSWIESQKQWRKTVKKGDTILVFDIGGGTTDFSLIEVIEEEGNLGLKRVSVGNHILLGGDNMDLALAYTVQAKLAAKGTKLDAWQFRGLSHRCREAKEKLLANPDTEKEPISILGRGSSLIKSNISTELTRSEIETILLEGFLPQCESSDYPEKKSKVGIREMGLPYEPDAAISRHLAQFLGSQSGEDGESTQSVIPTATLFNGGVTKSPLIRERILSVLNKWKGDAGKIEELVSSDLDLSVARGAAYYGLAKRGKGVRIKGGTAHSYYIGIETSMPAVPGVPTPIKALCVVPNGQEDGTEIEIRQEEFGLVVGEQAAFHIYGSNSRKTDNAGEVVDDWASQIEEMAEMDTKLISGSENSETEVIPVWLKIKLTEIGTLEIWCVSRDNENDRWKLEFNLRNQENKED